jgi:hypothetical protein
MRHPTNHPRPGNIGDSDMHDMVSAVASTGTCSPIVRVRGPTGPLIKRALDTGAQYVEPTPISLPIPIHNPLMKSSTPSAASSSRKSTRQRRPNPS